MTFKQSKEEQIAFCDTLIEEWEAELLSYRRSIETIESTIRDIQKDKEEMLKDVDMDDLGIGGGDGIPRV